MCTMCGFSDSVETFRDPFRYRVGALIMGRTERADRANALVSIVQDTMNLLKEMW